MSRLPLVDPERTTAELAAVFAKMPAKLNVFRMLAHAENTALPALRLANAILHRQQLGERHRELLILQVAALQHGAYEWHQHVPIGEAVGISKQQIAALARGDFAGEAFDEADRDLLAFGRRVIEDARVDDDCFQRIHRRLSDREIVECILTIGFYMMMARLTEVTETDLDSPQGLRLYESGKSRVVR